MRYSLRLMTSKTRLLLLFLYGSLLLLAAVQSCPTVASAETCDAAGDPSVPRLRVSDAGLILMPGVANQVVISNEGKGALTNISAAFSSGDADDFSVDNGCAGLSLTQGGCIVAVTYAPSAGDAHEAKLEIESSNGSRTVTLVGRTRADQLGIGLDIFPGGYPKLLESSNAERAVVFYNDPHSGAFAREVTLTSEPQGVLSLPSSVDVPAGGNQAVFSLRVRPDELNNCDHQVLLKAVDPDGRIALATINTVDDDVVQVGSGIRLLAAAPVRATDDDGIIEGNEIWDLLVEVVNDSGVPQNLTISIKAMTFNDSLIDGHECSISLSDRSWDRYGECRIWMRIPDDLRTDSYPIKIVGKVDGSVSFVDYTSIRIVNDSPVDFQIRSRMSSAFSLAPGEAFVANYSAVRYAEAGRSLSPAVTLVLENPQGTGDTIYRSYVVDLDKRVKMDVVAPDTPGLYRLWADINPDCALPDNCTNNRSEITTITVGYTAIPSAGTGGSISPSTVQTVGAGATAAFTVTADSGYDRSSTVGGSCPAGSWSGNVWTTGAISGNCTVSFSFTTSDTDGDGRPDVTDNCPTTPNADQADADRDRIGDLCDATPQLCLECLPGRGGWRTILR